MDLAKFEGSSIIFDSNGFGISVRRGILAGGRRGFSRSVHAGGKIQGTQHKLSADFTCRGINMFMEVLTGIERQVVVKRDNQTLPANKNRSLTTPKPEQARGETYA